jgi:hypothetical protein
MFTLPAGDQTIVGTNRQRRPHRGCTTRSPAAKTSGTLLAGVNAYIPGAQLVEGTSSRRGPASGHWLNNTISCRVMARVGETCGTCASCRPNFASVWRGPMRRLGRVCVRGRARDGGDVRRRADPHTHLAFEMPDQAGPGTSTGCCTGTKTSYAKRLAQLGGRESLRVTASSRCGERCLPFHLLKC